MERNLYKDGQITLNFKNLNIANITGIEAGKEIDEKTEIIYEGLQQNEYVIRTLNDRLLVQICKEMASGYTHFVKMKTTQTDGIKEEFIVKVKGRGTPWFLLCLTGVKRKSPFKKKFFVMDLLRNSWKFLERIFHALFLLVSGLVVLVPIGQFQLG